MIQPPMRRIVTVAASVAAIAFCASCFSLAPAPVGATNDPAALGSIQLSSPRLGDVTVVPTDCTSGGRQYFLGGDFVDPKSGFAVRLAIDPVGSPAIRVYSESAPFDKSITFRREECSVFHFSLDTTGWRVNHIDDYRMTLNVDCARGGESVRGSASTQHCH